MHRPLSRRAAVAALALAVAGASLPAFAQGGKWPEKPIKLIVPFAAGVSPDVVSRIIAEPLGRALSQPVVIDNRAGAAGIIGAEAAARGPADGYTLFMTVNSIMGINPSVYAKLPYDPLKDFVPVTQVARVKARPGSVEYGSLGVGSGPHLVMEMMNNMAGVRMVHIPCKAGTPREIVQRMNTEIARILKQPDVQHKLAEPGLQPVGNSIDEFDVVSRNELAKWGKLAKANNIKVE